MAHILVAEDDRNANKLICAVLRKAGHEPLCAYDGQEALDVLDNNHVDLLVSDVMMPRMDGMQLTRALRDAGYDLPILMLTAKQAVEDRREGFIVGADDYLTKPADMQELVLRVRSLLRRANVPDARTVVVGRVVLDGNALSVSRGTEMVTLPPKEFQLLFKLMASPGKAFTRMQLLDDVWGWDTTSAESTVNVHVNRLRTRFASWADDFEIQTVRGIGYRVVAKGGQHEGR